ncbi:kinase-like protein [Xylaria bambusicola]|uniref:kinase-like protein n=1 Tax=Xylaria bambusicola TaxID=326684 RepID=UPI002007D2B7|nr:kinase-like protein [Xylaria bambusicola]KAI0503272.1 kinase-like protein [Xylaria bambusicola]
MSTGTQIDMHAQGSQMEDSDQGMQPKFDSDAPKDERVEGGESEYIEYRPLGVDYVEDIGLYNTCRHHPVNLGDVLNGRYEVVRKLGQGGFGLIWLCHDMKTNKWRAVKILTASDSAHSKEEKNNHLVIPSERFWIDGPNGRHYCIALPVLGENAGDSRTHTAVRYLHERGVCHGDLKARNVLMRVKGLDKIGKDEMLKLLRQPSTLPVETESGKSPAPHAPDSPAITDFGESYLISDPSEFNVMSISYAPPEIIWQKTFQPGFHSDIWSLAATLYKLVCNGAMFDSKSFGGTLRDFEFFPGGLPQPYRAVYWEQIHAMCGRPSNTPIQSENETGVIDELRWEKQTNKFEYKSLIEEREKIVKRTGYADHFEAALGLPNSYCPNYHNKELTQDERNERKYIYLPRQDVIGVADLLRKLIRYDPAKRITISEVANHPWIKKSSKVSATTHILAQLTPGRDLSLASCLCTTYL